MIAEIGHYALVLALGLALIQAVAPIVGARRRDATLMAVAGPTALAQFVFVALAFAALRTDNRRNRLDQRQAERQHQRVMADLSDHLPRSYFLPASSFQCPVFFNASATSFGI